MESIRIRMFYSDTYFDENCCLNILLRDWRMHSYVYILLCNIWFIKILPLCLSFQRFLSKMYTIFSFISLPVTSAYQMLRSIIINQHIFSNSHAAEILKSTGEEIFKVDWKMTKKWWLSKFAQNFIFKSAAHK